MGRRRGPLVGGAAARGTASKVARSARMGDASPRLAGTGLRPSGIPRAGARLQRRGVFADAFSPSGDTFLTHLVLDAVSTARVWDSLSGRARTPPLGYGVVAASLAGTNTKSRPGARPRASASGMRRPDPSSGAPLGPDSPLPFTEPGAIGPERCGTLVRGHGGRPIADLGVARGRAHRGPPGRSLPCPSSRSVLTKA